MQHRHALATDRTRLYFHHDGAAFPETLYFWGLPGNGDFGWGNPGNMIRNTWIRHYVSGGIELTAMMLDRYEVTLDAAFARETLLPIATAVTTYYDQHWKRGADGKQGVRTQFPKARLSRPVLGEQPNRSGQQTKRQSRANCSENIQRHRLPTYR